MSAHGSSGAQPSGLQLPFFHEVDHLQHRFDGVHPNHKPIIWVFIIINVLFFIFAPQQAIINYEIVFFVAPIWMPIYLYIAAHDRFSQMNFAKFSAEQKYVLLEIRVPREVT